MVRDASSLGTQSGWACKFRVYAIGLKAIGVVRAECGSGRKSSKRVQCGEPLLSFVDNTGLCSSQAVRYFVFRFESSLGISAADESCEQ